MESNEMRGTPCRNLAAQQSESQLELGLRARRVEIVVARSTDFPLVAWVIADGKLIYFRGFDSPDRTAVEAFVTRTRSSLSGRAPGLDIDVTQRLASALPLPCPPPPPNDELRIEAAVSPIRAEAA